MNNNYVLKTGENLECRVIDRRDTDLVPALRTLLAHKGDIWQLHLEEEFAGRIKDLETRFYVGLIGSDLVGNIMTVEFKGLGIMGHVYTPPEHRRKGICDVLMDFHMADFRERKGNALYLNTGFESAPFFIYQKHGYRPIPEAPGSMWWSPDSWSPDTLWDDLERLKIAEPAWRHWPSANVFMLQTRLPAVRNVTYGKFGCANAEATFLHVLSDLRNPEKRVQARVLETRDGHMAGLATLAPERRWGSLGTTYVFDLCVHPDAEDVPEQLVEDFQWPAAHVLAYASDDDTAAVNRYAQMGFRPHSHIERFFGTTGLLILSRE